MSAEPTGLATLSGRSAAGGVSAQRRLRATKPPTPPPDAAVVTVGQFAALVQLNPKAVYALIAAGKLPGVRRFGRSVRVVVAEAIAPQCQPAGVRSSAEVAERSKGNPR